MSDRVGILRPCAINNEEIFMPNILHRIGTKSSPDKAYSALTDCAELGAWWTNDTKGEEQVGGVLHFRFGDLGFFDMKILELEPLKHVLWQVVDGPAEWIGTKVSFELNQVDEYTIILFKHEGWREPVEFMHHCSTKWATFLMSLKAFIETGKGTPYPNDVIIGNWN